MHHTSTLVLTVASYIEGFYNPYRLHSLLDYNSPMVFERIHDLKTAHAR